MNLEISKEERFLLLAALLRSGDFGRKAAELGERLIELRDGNPLPVPLEQDGPKRSDVPSALPRKDEQLSGGVSGRPQSSDQPQRTPQTVESVRWSSGKFDRESVEQITLTPSKIERKEGQNGPMISVMWPARGRGYLYASCFEESLFPWVSARIKQETVFYVTYKGKYTNIVGVKA